MLNDHLSETIYTWHTCAAVLVYNACLHCLYALLCIHGMVVGYSARYQIIVYALSIKHHDTYALSVKYRIIA